MIYEEDVSERLSTLIYFQVWVNGCQGLPWKKCRFYLRSSHSRLVSRKAESWAQTRDQDEHILVHWEVRIYFLRVLDVQTGCMEIQRFEVHRNRVRFLVESTVLFVMHSKRCTVAYSLRKWQRLLPKQHDRDMRTSWPLFRLNLLLWSRKTTLNGLHDTLSWIYVSLRRLYCLKQGKRRRE